MLDKIAELRTVEKVEDEKIEILPQFLNELTEQKRFSFESDVNSYHKAKAPCSPEEKIQRSKDSEAGFEGAIFVLEIPKWREVNVPNVQF
jgi:hypothetical protein